MKKYLERKKRIRYEGTKSQSFEENREQRRYNNKINAAAFEIDYRNRFGLFDI